MEKKEKKIEKKKKRKTNYLLSELKGQDVFFENTFQTSAGI